MFLVTDMQKFQKKNVIEISSLLNQYFSISKNLKIVCVLIDSRHGFKKIDLAFLSFLEKNKLNYKLILTKSDKITKSNKEEIIKTFRNFEGESFYKILY